MSQGSFNYHLERLLHWMADVGGVLPDYRGILVIESPDLLQAESQSYILGGLIQRRPTISRKTLKIPNAYQGRFRELLDSGFNWIHLRALGIIDEHLIVSVDYPLQSLGVPSEDVAVNLSGPPHEWFLRWKLRD